MNKTSFIKILSDGICLENNEQFCWDNLQKEYKYRFHLSPEEEDGLQDQHQSRVFLDGSGIVQYGSSLGIENDTFVLENIPTKNELSKFLVPYMNQFFAVLSNPTNKSVQTAQVIKKKYNIELDQPDVDVLNIGNLKSYFKNKCLSYREIITQCRKMRNRDGYIKKSIPNIVNNESVFEIWERSPNRKEYKDIIYNPYLYHITYYPNDTYEKLIYSSSSYSNTTTNSSNSSSSSSNTSSNNSSSNNSSSQNTSSSNNSSSKIQNNSSQNNNNSPSHNNNNNSFSSLDISSTKNKYNSKDYINKYLGYYYKDFLHLEKCLNNKSHERLNFILNHLKKIICNNSQECYEYFLKWLSFKYRFPYKKLQTAIILKGMEGSGKGIFIKAYGSLFGNSYIYVQNIDYAIGKFNTLIDEKVLAFFDETDVKNKKDYNLIKSLITEDYVTIEGKFRDAKSVRSYMNIIWATNFNPIQLGIGSGKNRRFLCMETSNYYSIQSEESKNYFNKLNDAFYADDSLGLKSFAYLLYTKFSEKNVQELKQFGLGQNSPNTEMKKEMQMEALDSVGQWIYYSLVRGWHTPIHKISDIYDPRMLAILHKGTGRKWKPYDNISNNIFKIVEKSIRKKCIGKNEELFGDEEEEKKEDGGFGGGELVVGKKEEKKRRIEEEEIELFDNEELISEKKEEKICYANSREEEKYMINYISFLIDLQRNIIQNEEIEGFKISDNKSSSSSSNIVDSEDDTVYQKMDSMWIQQISRKDLYESYRNYYYQKKRMNFKNNNSSSSSNSSFSSSNSNNILLVPENKFIKQVSFYLNISDKFTHTNQDHKIIPVVYQKSKINYNIKYPRENEKDNINRILVDAWKYCLLKLSSSSSSETSSNNSSSSELKLDYNHQNNHYLNHQYPEELELYTSSNIQYSSSSNHYHQKKNSIVELFEALTKTEKYRYKKTQYIILPSYKKSIEMFQKITSIDIISSEEYSEEDNNNIISIINNEKESKLYSSSSKSESSNTSSTSSSDYIEYNKKKRKKESSEIKKKRRKIDEEEYSNLSLSKTTTTTTNNNNVNHQNNHHQINLLENYEDEILKNLFD